MPRTESAISFKPNPRNRAMTRIWTNTSGSSRGSTAPINTDTTCMKTMARDAKKNKYSLLNLLVRIISRMKVLLAIKKRAVPVPYFRDKDYSKGLDEASEEVGRYGGWRLKRRRRYLNCRVHF